LSAGRAEPIEIEAEIGNEIVFIVLDESRHNIAEERTNKHDARLESGEFGSGESYSLSFSSSGMYSFYDRMNTDIHVVINVKK
jgi:plastocyanin